MKHGASPSARLTRPADAQQRPDRSWLRAVAGVAVLCLAALAVYYPALQGGYVWDDDAHITKSELRSVDGLRRIWFEVGAAQQYYPLVHSVFWIEHKLWGDNTLGYHLVNVGLHVASASLVWLILRKLRIPGAFLAALLFTVHPVNVESVAWISELKNTLSTFFYLLSLAIYLAFDETRSWKIYSAVLACFALGLMCKTVIATLPAAILVILWWRRGTISWLRDVGPLAPWFAIGGGCGLFTAWVERHYIGATGADFSLSFLDRIVLAGRVAWFYLAKLLWPVDLIFIYPHWDIDAKVWWQWLYPLAALGVIVALWLVRRRWRGPLAAALFFLGTLFPVLGFFNVYPFRYSYVADHFQYLASLGIITLVAAGAAYCVQRFSGAARAIGATACLAVVAVLAFQANAQSRQFRSEIALYEEIITRNPQCWMAYGNLGKLYAARGEYDQAIDKSRTALKLKSDYPDPFNNLGLIKLKFNQPEEAIEYFKQAIAINPAFAQAHVGLGSCFKALNRWDEARRQFEIAIEYQPGFAIAYCEWGDLLARQGYLENSVEYFEKALQFKPDYEEAQLNLGNVLNGLGKYDEARRHFEAALKVNPDLVIARLGLSYIEARTGDLRTGIANITRLRDEARSQGKADIAWLADRMLENIEAATSSDAEAAAPNGASAP